MSSLEANFHSAASCKSLADVATLSIACLSRSGVRTTPRASSQVVERRADIRRLFGGNTGEGHSVNGDVSIYICCETMIKRGAKAGKRRPGSGLALGLVEVQEVNRPSHTHAAIPPRSARVGAVVWGQHVWAAERTAVRQSSDEAANGAC